MIAPALREELRTEILGRIQASGIIGIRNDALLKSIKRDPRYAQLTAEDLMAETTKMALHGWVTAEQHPLEPTVATMKLTEQGREFCYENAIGN